MHSQAHTAQKGWVVSRYVDATRARLGSDQGWTWTPAWTYMKYLGITEEGEVEVDGEGNCTINFAEAATHVLLKSLHMHSQQRRTPAQRTATTQYPGCRQNLCRRPPTHRKIEDSYNDCCLQQLHIIPTNLLLQKTCIMTSVSNINTLLALCYGRCMLAAIRS